MPSEQNLNRDVHIHVPDNAIPKEGPSAGLTIAVALASAISGRPVRGDLALTGEITLRGKVMAVGGIREKLLAAHRAGIHTVLIPKANATDLDEVPKDIRAKLDVKMVETIDEAMQLALAPRASQAAVRASV
jgi:ATP-dependent Lon protease